MPKSIAFLIFISLAVTACAPKSMPPIVENGVVNEEQKRQQTVVLKGYLDRLARVDRVAYALASKNSGYCVEVTFSSGMLALDAESVQPPYREAAKVIQGYDGRVRVVAVVPGSPADASGVRAGDFVVGLNGKSITGAAKLSKALREEQWVTLNLERAGEKLNADVKQLPACDYPVIVKEGQTINAFAFRDRIWITSSMVKFVTTDDELALILGHELAHINMNHLRAKRNNATVGTLLIDLPIALLTGVNTGMGNAIGASAYSQDFESEADYVGMYNTARAGFDINGVSDLWRRMATEHPTAIYTASTHPTTANRFVVLEATRDEINAKKAAGKELEPNMKAGK